MRGEGKINITLRLEKTVIYELDYIAKRAGVGRSSVIRYALRKLLPPNFRPGRLLMPRGGARAAENIEGSIVSVHREFWGCFPPEEHKT